ncbi:hypothetical protein RB598_005270 [Gaeumannomyces tritici]
MAAAMVGVMVAPSLAAAAAMPPQHEDDVPGLALRVFPEAWLPLETGRSIPDPARGFTPKPTPPPSHPEFGFMELAKRQTKPVTGFTMSPNTCGYISSSRGKCALTTRAWLPPGPVALISIFFSNLSNLAAGALTCINSDATCSSSGRYMGCCTSSSCTSVLTSCVPSSLASSCSRTATSGVLCCSVSSRGFCSVYLFSRSTATRSTLTLFVCATAAGTGTLLDFPVDYTQTSTSRSTTSSTRTASPSRSSSTTRSRTDRDSDAATCTPPPGGQSEQQQETQTATGAIVGGVIGGVAVLALAGLAIFFLVRRARRKGASAQHSSLPPNAPPPSQPFMAPQTFPPTSPYQAPSASSHLSPYPSPVPFGGGGGGGGGVAPQGYPTSTGYMVPPQQHQQAGGVSPYSSVAGDSMYAYPSMTQYGASPMAPHSSPQMPYGGQGAAATATATTYSAYDSAYDPAYGQQPQPQPQVQPPPVEYKAYNPNMAPQAVPPPARNQGPQEMP